MPVIKVWCLPKLSERKLNELFRGIVSTVESVPELGLKGEKSMTVLFPVDMMRYGLGTEIIVEVTGLFVKPERTPEVRQRLADALSCVIRGFFQKAMVEVFVFPFDPSQGFSANPRTTRGHTPTPKEVQGGLIACSPDPLNRRIIHD
jgi:hypothetical protein